jgi:cytochrome bd ubiquinol oxidase subunit II
MTLELGIALVMLVTLIAYALLAGADFGGGVWDLLSRGPRAAAQRQRIAEAIGPVWEANHVWLIFLVVLLFTCFPPTFAAISVMLFWPLHLVLVGIALRGASFVFRAYGSTHATVQLTWSRIFGAASVVTPFLLGAALGAISTGSLRVGDAGAFAASTAWLGPFPLMTGLLALLLCAYHAAVYLAWESEGPLREDFRRRALATWIVAGVISFALLLLGRREAPRLWSTLTTAPAAWIVIGGTLLAIGSALALVRRRFSAARVLAGAHSALLLVGWAVAQFPYLYLPRSDPDEQRGTEGHAHAHRLDPAIWRRAARAIALALVFRVQGTESIPVHSLQLMRGDTQRPGHCGPQAPERRQGSADSRFDRWREVRHPPVWGHGDERGAAWSAPHPRTQYAVLENSGRRPAFR